MTRLLAVVFLLLVFNGSVSGQNPDYDLIFGPQTPDDGRKKVGIELVLAVDASGSIHKTELDLQRKGYANVLRSPEFLERIPVNNEHNNQAVAIFYFEWSSSHFNFRNQSGWRVIDSEYQAIRLANFIELPPYRGTGDSTNMEAALDHANNLIESNELNGSKKVIDISADGKNYSLLSLNAIREEIRNNGTTINGLAIKLPPDTTLHADEMVRSKVGPDDTDITEYMDKCVRIGHNSFVMEVKDKNDFDEVIRRKMIREISLDFPSFISAAYADEFEDSICFEAHTEDNEYSGEHTVTGE